MENLNPQQNPNFVPGMQSEPINPQPQMPAVTSKRKVSPLMWGILAIVLVGAAAALWYISQMANEQPVVQQPVIDQEAREDKVLGAEIQSVDMGDLDKELQNIDKDINSL